MPMMKADFQPHGCTFLLFPSRRDVWRKNALPAQQLCLSLAQEISRFERVYLGTDRRLCTNLAVPMQYNDIWVRDTGPIPTSDSLVAFRFNAWGGEEGLYKDWKKDSSVPIQIADFLSFPLVHASLTLEGGNLTTDGVGTLIAVRPSILSENRNGGISQKKAEAEFSTFLGVKKIIWLDEGLRYDETGGHVDNLCAFAAPHVLLLAWTDDPAHPQYKIVRRAKELLSRERDAAGDPFEIVPIPLPRPFLRTEEDCEGLVLVDGSKRRTVGEPIQASYINFIFVNGGVIVPQFGLPEDEAAKEIFQKIFPLRKIVTFPSREIVLGGGGLHCITRNL